MLRDVDEVSITFVSDDFGVMPNILVIHSYVAYDIRVVITPVISGCPTYLAKEL